MKPDPQADASRRGPDAVVRLDTPLGAMHARWEPLNNDGDTSGERDGVLKCLNVQYADIPYRWAAPRRRLPSQPWQGIRDCTVFGPGCPQTGRPLFGVKRVPMFGHLGQDAAGNATVPVRPDREDEFACLNLNIYGPAAVNSGNTVLPPTTSLPVLVWVHGGSYQVGAGSVDAYDGSHLVCRGLAIGAPVVVVAINYRLGVLGFLHSKELAESAAVQPDVPLAFRSTANLGLVDCKCAFDWLKENIHYFGGDPENITAMGESAGAGAIHHMMTVPQLYIDIQRIILSSSTCMSIQLLRADEAQHGFDAICHKFGIATKSSSAYTVEQLRSISVDKLVEETWFMSSTFRPIWDDITITEDPRQVAFQPQLWNPALRSIVLGTCQNEPWIREAAIIANKKMHDLLSVIHSRIPPDDALRRRAAELYADADAFPWHATAAELDVPAHNRCSMALEGHCRYNTPATLFSRSFVDPSGSDRPRTLYRYVFEYATEHWPKTWPATHTADILPMFLHGSLNDTDRRVAETFADQLLQFTGGSIEMKGEEAQGEGKGTDGKPSPAPWQRYTADLPRLNVLGADGGWSVVGETDGAFDLSEERVQFWADVLKAVLGSGTTGWPEMAR